ncbi:MAG: 1,5-anhydro-D-fructose reductase [Firmicutes bacterium ADurb.Bin419]|nr:MAG: 1,5-anhydro-D-fructose reductase [Firmicutes bacterium ADurb.Bin419]
MQKKIRWGILGCGRIAASFAESLKYLPDAELIAVASKTKSKALEFAKTFSVEYCYDNYLDLIKNQSVDVVYVATTHNYHYETCVLCIENKKPILCEKPFTVNSKQAEQLIALARQNKVFLMEAMWTRFLPCVIEIERTISEGTIGDVKMFKGDFGIGAKNREGSPKYYFDPYLAGGALLDIGVYPVSFSSMVYKKSPDKIETYGYIGDTNVDEQAAYIFEYGDGKMAVLSSSFIVDMPHDGLICGTKGYIRIPNFSRPTRFFVKLSDQEEREIEIPFVSNGLQYQAQEVNRCLREGKLESEIMPLDQTLEIMDTLDRLRAKWGLKYPVE